MRGRDGYAGCRSGKVPSTSVSPQGWILGFDMTMGLAVLYVSDPAVALVGSSHSVNFQLCCCTALYPRGLNRNLPSSFSVAAGYFAGALAVVSGRNDLLFEDRARKQLVTGPRREATLSCTAILLPDDGYATAHVCGWGVTGTRTEMACCWRGQQHGAKAARMSGWMKAMGEENDERRYAVR
ncbi:hypothetical protein LY76DRAFT_248636 [Colletotrichum caudatum]|nr:hypothetical protein LY76DRAFT_248636 [Colletotrichum caudatum]